MCVQHIYCNISVHASAVLKRGCDVRSFTSKIENPGEVTQFVRLRGI